jgi:hypothetical protein
MGNLFYCLTNKTHNTRVASPNKHVAHYQKDHACKDTLTNNDIQPIITRYEQLKTTKQPSDVSKLVDIMKNTDWDATPTPVATLAPKLEPITPVATLIAYAEPYYYPSAPPLITPSAPPLIANTSFEL